jgi:hypothetical protein
MTPATRTETRLVISALNAAVECAARDLITTALGYGTFVGMIALGRPALERLYGRGTR